MSRWKFAKVKHTKKKTQYLGPKTGYLYCEKSESKWEENRKGKTSCQKFHCFIIHNYFQPDLAFFQFVGALVGEERGKGHLSSPCIKFNLISNSFNNSTT